MIFHNEVTLGGEVTKVQAKDDAKIARIFINVPSGDVDDERAAGKTVNVQIDVVGDRYEQAKIAKEGDFFSCKAQLVKRKVKPDNQPEDKKWSILWLQAINSRDIVVIPGGGKYARAAFNEVTFAGKVTRISDLQSTGSDKKMIFVTAMYMPKMEKNASEEEKKDATVYVDAAFFGGTAEKYIKQYLRDKDVILITGSMTQFKEKWTVKGKDVISLRVNARDAKFVTPVEGGGKRNSDRPDTNVYKNDEDLDFNP